MTAITTRIRNNLVGLRMPRALEVLDHTLRRLETGEITALEALDDVLNEEFTLREGRRVNMALTVKFPAEPAPMTMTFSCFSAPRLTRSSSSSR